MDSNTSLNSPDTPWILYGGSLAGAETAISLNQYGGDGGVLWAGIATSGTTHAKLTASEWLGNLIVFYIYDRIADDCSGMLRSRNMDHKTALAASMDWSRR